MRAAVIALSTMFILLAVISNPGTPTPLSPNPDECRIEPRLFFGEDWLRVAGLTVSPSLFPSMTRTEPYPPVLPSGPLPAPWIIKEIERTMYELGACINSRDSPRGVSLYTDAYWARIMAELAAKSGRSIERTALGLAVAVQQDPGADSDDFSPVVDLWVGDARVIADGRIAALGAILFADGSDYAALFVFAQFDDRWLIDDRQMYDLNSLATPFPAFN